MDRGPLGKLLVERGVLFGDALDDALARQAHRMPIASQCYLLGYATERPLAAVLATHAGMPAVILDECVVKLAVLGGLSRELARRALMLPVYEDAERVVVAVASPDDVRGVCREMERIRGKRVELHIALEVTLARAIRTCFLARERGDSYWVGPEAVVDPSQVEGRLAVAWPDAATDGRVDDLARAHRALLEDVTKEVVSADLPDLEDDEERSQAPTDRTAALEDSVSGVDGWTGGARSWGSATGSSPGMSSVDDTHDIGADDGTIEIAGELDVAPVAASDGPTRILIVDDDFATRHLLVKELQPLGYVTSTAASGGEAVTALQHGGVDLVIADILLPEIDGFRLCRAIKRSRRLGGVPVVLMSAVIDSGRVTPDVLARYGADAYLEKPLDMRRVHRVVRELAAKHGARPRDSDAGLARAIARYQAGDVDGAINLLREGIAADPASAKHRFVLANLLQRKAMVTEAIDEYENVIDLEPEYFPALTRLAYLYYKQGHLARAVETWRKSLPVCDDPALRRNIETFMRKLIGDLGRSELR
ncbi:MAG: response regulator [Deltaproteobacteria bacterium]|nr:response regulator [Deltaproteobacteria bacterium]